MLQTTTTPTSVAAKYGNFGRTPNPATPDPSRMFVMLVGPGGSGKTNFLMSVAGLLSINCDLSPPPRPAPDAPMPDCQFFPALNDDAQPVDFMGNPINFRWEMVEELRLQLVEAAAKNLPRPRAIAIDSAGAAMRMLIDYVTRNAVALNLVKPEEAGRVKEFWHLNGLAGYGRAYDILLNFIVSLRQAGYGVFLTFHITPTVMQIGENISTTVWEPASTPGLWARLFPMADMALPIRQLSRMKVEPVYTEHNGQKIKTGTKQTQQLYYAMEFNNAQLTNVTKRRVALPELIELPSSGGWDIFAQKFREAYGTPTAS
jgi:energy-coupling factor transporter ATP-binding protein EcfA2